MSYVSPKWNNGSAPPLSAENLQDLTDAVQEQGEALETMCNPNLLDSWYFGKPVNQRGQTEWLSSASANIPCVDRWDWWGQYAADATLKLSNDGLQLIGTAGVAGLYQGIEQRIEKDRLPVGATATLSALVKADVDAGIILSLGGQTYQIVTVPANTWTLIAAVLNAPSVEQTHSISIQRNTPHATFTVKAVKLELGSQQTLAHQDADGNWVLNEIPDYGEQLRRCQRYLIPINNWTRVRASYYSATALFFTVPIPSTMRTTPAILDPSGALAVQSVSGVDQAGFTFECNMSTPGSISVRAIKNSHGLTDGQLVKRGGGSFQAVFFSSEL